VHVAISGVTVVVGTFAIPRILQFLQKRDDVAEALLYDSSPIVSASRRKRSPRLRQDVGKMLECRAQIVPTSGVELLLIIPILLRIGIFPSLCGAR
jgi:hypothetical protein